MKVKQVAFESNDQILIIFTNLLNKTRTNTLCILIL